MCALRRAHTMGYVKSGVEHSGGKHVSRRRGESEREGSHERRHHRHHDTDRPGDDCSDESDGGRRRRHHHHHHHQERRDHHSRRHHRSHSRHHAGNTSSGDRIAHKIGEEPTPVVFKPLTERSRRHRSKSKGRSSRHRTPRHKDKESEDVDDGRGQVDHHGRAFDVAISGRGEGRVAAALEPDENPVPSAARHRHAREGGPAEFHSPSASFRGPHGLGHGHGHGHVGGERGHPALRAAQSFVEPSRRHKHRTRKVPEPLFAAPLGIGVRDTPTRDLQDELVFNMANPYAVSSRVKGSPTRGELPYQIPPGQSFAPRLDKMNKGEKYAVELSPRAGRAPRTPSRKATREAEDAARSKPLEGLLPQDPEPLHIIELASRESTRLGHCFTAWSGRLVTLPPGPAPAAVRSAWQLPIAELPIPLDTAGVPHQSKYLQESMTRIMVCLDGLDMGGMPDLRSRRKAVFARTDALTQAVDQWVHDSAGDACTPPSSRPATPEDFDENPRSVSCPPEPPEPPADGGVDGAAGEGHDAGGGIGSEDPEAAAAREKQEARERRRKRRAEKERRREERARKKEEAEAQRRQAEADAEADAEAGAGSSETEDEAEEDDQEGDFTDEEGEAGKKKCAIM